MQYCIYKQHKGQPWGQSQLRAFPSSIYYCGCLPLPQGSTMSWTGVSGMVRLPPRSLPAHKLHHPRGTIFYKGQQVSSATTLMLCIRRSRARSPNTHRTSQTSTTGHAACASCTTDWSKGLSGDPVPAGPHMAGAVEDVPIPAQTRSTQEQHPDLLVLTGLPVSGRMVLAFLFITGWLAILHHQQLERRAHLCRACWL